MPPTATKAELLGQPCCHQLVKWRPALPFPATEDPQLSLVICSVTSSLAFPQTSALSDSLSGSDTPKQGVSKECFRVWVFFNSLDKSDGQRLSSCRSL